MTVGKTLANLYLDYRNEWLTVQSFAAYHDLTEDQARALLVIGRDCHESQVLKYLQGIDQPATIHAH